jgi:hypothetical protein
VDARGEGCRYSTIIIYLVSIVETLISFNNSRGLVSYYRGLSRIMSYKLRRGYSR